MTRAEISLAFAREVAGYPGAVLLVYVSPTAVYNQESRLPDYANDWNATIAVLKAKGMTWHSGPTGAWVTKGFVSKNCNHLKDDGEYTPRALCLAAIKCVRESKR